MGFATKTEYQNETDDQYRFFSFSLTTHFAGSKSKMNSVDVNCRKSDGSSDSKQTQGSLEAMNSKNLPISKACFKPSMNFWVLLELTILKALQ